MSGGETEIDIIISSMFIRNTDTLIFSGSVEGGKKKKKKKKRNEEQRKDLKLSVIQDRI